MVRAAACRREVAACGSGEPYRPKKCRRDAGTRHDACAPRVAAPCASGVAGTDVALNVSVCASLRICAAPPPPCLARISSGAGGPCLRLRCHKRRNPETTALGARLSVSTSYTRTCVRSTPSTHSVAYAFASHGLLSRALARTHSAKNATSSWPGSPCVML